MADNSGSPWRQGRIRGYLFTPPTFGFGRATPTPARLRDGMGLIGPAAGNDTARASARGIPNSAPGRPPDGVAGFQDQATVRVAVSNTESTSKWRRWTGWLPSIATTTSSVPARDEAQRRGVHPVSFYRSIVTSAINHQEITPYELRWGR
jgi:hypothetical protein